MYSILKIARFGLVLLCCFTFSSISAYAQETWDVPLREAKRMSEAHAQEVENGLFMVMERGMEMEFILLNENLQFKNTLHIPSIGQSRDYMGVRETPNEYIVHTDLGISLEAFYVDKATFTVERFQFNPVAFGDRPMRDFILDNEFFSLSLNRKKRQVKVMRSFNNKENTTFIYQLTKEQLKAVSNGKLSALAIDHNQEQSIYAAQTRQKYFVDNGTLVLTIDEHGTYNSDLLVYKFDTTSNAQGEPSVEVMSKIRTMARLPGHNASTYVHQGKVYSLTIGGRRVILDVYSLEDMSLITQLTSEETEAQKSIKPLVVKKEGATSIFDLSEREFVKDKQMLRKLDKGEPGIVVVEKYDHLELTIGTYDEPPGSGVTMMPGTTNVGGPGGTVAVPTYYYFPDFYAGGAGSTYFYQVKLDKENLESLGASQDLRTMDLLAKSIRNSNLKLETYNKSRVLFRIKGKHYVGYQEREDKEFKIRKID